MTTVLTKEKILCTTINIWYTIFAITTLVICYFELFLIWSCESYLVLDKILSWTTYEIIELKYVLICLWLNKNGVTLSYIGIIGVANFSKIYFTDEKSNDFMLLIEEFLNIDMSTLEDDIFQWEGFVDEFIRILFGVISNIDHGSLCGFL